MNSLVVSQYYWPETFRIDGLVEKLKDHECIVAVLACKPNYLDGSSPPTTIFGAGARRVLCGVFL
jgi:hypothetical protein